MLKISNLFSSWLQIMVICWFIEMLTIKKHVLITEIILHVRQDTALVMNQNRYHRKRLNTN
jgi:hypothetical protein